MPILASLVLNLGTLKLKADHMITRVRPSSRPTGLLNSLCVQISDLAFIAETTSLYL